MSAKEYYRNIILKNEWVLKLYGNELGETRVVFCAKIADTIDPYNFVAWVNNLDIAVMLICSMIIVICGMIQNITMSPAENVSTCIKIFLHYQVYMLSVEMIAHLFFFFFFLKKGNCR